MSNKTRDIEILDGRVSKLLIMLKKHIKEGNGGITEEQLIQKLLDYATKDLLLTEETERKDADLGLKDLIDAKPNTSDLDSKVDKVIGKVLSSNDFTDEQKLKIADLEARTVALETVQ